MSREERKTMIVRDRRDLSLSRQCRLLSVGRSSFYYAPKGESAETLALMRRIDELFLKYPFFGSRQMARQLRREGVDVGRHRVRRLMRLMGLEAIYQAPRTSVPHPAHRVQAVDVDQFELGFGLHVREILKQVVARRNAVAQQGPSITRTTPALRGQRRTGRCGS